MTEYVELQIDALIPSPTNPRDPNEQPDPELTESIRANGIIEPLIVRPVTVNKERFYEIAAGHRRKINGIAAGLTSAPCIVRELTDDQMIDYHIHENIHRKELGPMEEAKVYKLMRERGNSNAEIAARAAKSEKYITQRIKLNDLIPELQADVAVGVLPLTHAFALCKYGADAQEAAMSQMYGGQWVLPDSDWTLDEDEGLVYDKDGNIVEDEDELTRIYELWETQEKQWVPDKSALQYTATRLESYLQNQFTLRLDKAIFDLNDTRLRADKLTCPNCPERTGANPTLFEMDDETPDFCLNRTCYTAKTETLVQLTREAVAKEKGVEVEKVALLSEQWNTNGLPDGWIGRQGVNVLKFEFQPDISEEDQLTPDGHCEFEQIAIYKGEPITICTVQSGCAVHHRENTPEYKAQYTYSSSPRSPEEVEAAEAAKKQNRKEELWNVRVGEETRQRIVVEAAKTFAEGIGLMFDTRLVEIKAVMAYTTARLWQTRGYNEEFSLRLFLEKAGIELPTTMYGFDYEASVLGLDAVVMRQLYFILTHFWKGAMPNKTWASQEKVQQLAVRHGINYTLIDAQVRVDLSAKKYQKRHKAYLQQVEVNDPAARVPLLFTEPVEKVEEKAACMHTNRTAETLDGGVDCVDCGEQIAKPTITNEELREALAEDLAEDQAINTETETPIPEPVEAADSVSDPETVSNEAQTAQGPQTAKDVACSECSAAPGEKCKGPRGEMIGFHDARKKLFAPVAEAEGLAEIKEIADASEGRIIVGALNEAVGLFDQAEEIADDEEIGLSPALIEAGVLTEGPRDDESEELSDEGDAFGEAPELLGETIEDVQSLDESVKSLADLFEEAIAE